MATLVHPALGSLAGSPGQALEHVPFLLSFDQAYLDEPSAYIRDRACGRWHPAARNASDYYQGSRLAENTVTAYATDLQNFVSFLEATGSDWRADDAHGLLDAYDRAMSNGAWSEKAGSSLPQ
ncbi:hypothetical protein LJR225_003119 [Phenylobacterium sp. LjRoot225]|uniref:hypothetical protein n=1 Tax=Phenylobacterium sp. LjRoot225 TaxID=3342285 RepID=UPI003ECD28E3